MTDAGYWIPDTGYRILDARYLMPDTGYLMLVGLCGGLSGSSLGEA